MRMEPIANGIARYILANEPVSFASIRERARGKDWYTDDIFWKVIAQVGRDPRISTATHGADMLYRAKRIAPPRQAPAPLFSVIQYPVMVAGENDASHTSLNGCFCGMSYTLQERKEMKLSEHDEDCPKYEKGNSYPSGNLEVPPQ